MSDNYEIKINSDQLLSALKQQITKGLTECGMQAVTYATRSLTDSGAVDTGNLRNNVVFEVDGSAIEPFMVIGTNVEYAPYIEFGTGIGSTLGGRQTPWKWQDAKTGKWYTTRGMQARPFIKPALADHKEVYKRILESNLKG